MQIRAIYSSANGLFIGLYLYCRHWQTMSHTVVAGCKVSCVHLALLLAGGVVALWTTPLAAQTLDVVLPGAEPPSVAVAETSGGSIASRGTWRDGMVRFENLLPTAPYQVRIEMRNGRVLQGVDLGWYAAVQDGSPSEPLDEDARREIAGIVTKVPQFYNRSELLLLDGNAQRATALVQLIRDTAFHGDRGGEIIWRVELWYFEFQGGGWARVPQQNVVLRRERFRDREAFERATSMLQWRKELGGIRIGKDEHRRIDLRSE